MVNAFFLYITYLKFHKLLQTLKLNRPHAGKSTCHSTKGLAAANGCPPVQIGNAFLVVPSCAFFFIFNASFIRYTVSTTLHQGAQLLSPDGVALQKGAACFKLKHFKAHRGSYNEEPCMHRKPKETYHSNATHSILKVGH